MPLPKRARPALTSLREQAVILTRNPDHEHLWLRGPNGCGKDWRMSDVPTSKLSFRDVFTMVCSAGSVTALIVGSISASGERAGKLDENTKAIARLDAADIAKTELLSKIDGRTIRIETKLEMIAPTKGERP
jgi:hypothetical protein